MPSSGAQCQIPHTRYKGVNRANPPLCVRPNSLTVLTVLRLVSSLYSARLRSPYLRATTPTGAWTPGGLTPSIHLPMHAGGYAPDTDSALVKLQY